MPSRPNVLILHMDQLRADCLGAYGNREVKTPHFDAIAEEGVRHDAHFASYPMCVPSRCSLLCGQFPHEHTVTTNQGTLHPGIATFAGELRAAGWRTAAVGKMHLNPTYTDVGFDTLILSEQDGPGRFEDDYHRFLMERGALDTVDITDQRWEFRRCGSREYLASFGTEPSNLPEGLHATAWTGDRAVEQISSWREGEQNLLMVGFMKPHHPFDPPAPYDTMYNPDKITPLPGWTEEVPRADIERGAMYFDYSSLDLEKLKKTTAFYYATISHVDDHVGRIVGALKARGAYENTLIVVTSDHGEYMGYHHMLLKGGHMYDPVLKIPLIIKYPGGRGGVCGGLSSNTAVAAEILRACGVEAPAGMRRGLGEECAAVVSEQSGGSFGNTLSVRTETHRLIKNVKTGAELLFDLRADPHELKNTAGEPAAAQALAGLQKLLEAHMQGDFPKVYSDPGAKTAEQAAVPTAAEVEKMRRYTREKYRELTGFDVEVQ